MKPSPTIIQPRNWISLIAAMALGPAFLKIGYATNLQFGAAGAAYFLVCVIIVPLLISIADRLKFLIWQLAIVSLTLSVLGDNLRITVNMPGSEIAGITFMFWASGTLLSSPLPIYILLRPMAQRQRLIFGIAIAAIVLSLWFGIKKISF